MKEWTTYHLEDICKEILSGGDAAKYDCVKAKSNTYKYPVFANAIDEDGLYGYCNDYVVNVPSVTIAARGAGTGYVAYRDTPYTPIVRLISLIPKENVNPLFLYYRLKIANLRGDGSAIPQLTVPMVKKLKVTLPDYETQKTIANILRSLDVKIQLNKQINDNLEQQAQALYKSWFIDFEPFKDGEFVESEIGLIPEGWKVGTLSDLAEITMGQSPSGKSYNECGEGILFYQGRAEFGDRYPSIRLYTTEPSRIAEQNSVLLSVRAPVGDTNIACNKCCIGRGLASIKAKHGFNSFIFYMIKSMRDQFDMYNGEGTVFGSINRDSLNSLNVIVPTNDVINEFEKIVAPLDLKYKSLFAENLLLTQQRDTLLPKLMSGEIKVNEIDC